ncbi:hypothetical protein Q5424_08175 [Conexibacter sp. JD483]|uniref:hypothetical protein n=1 Tax=unclassified Conexibacter TaxID=2627773 RepID=UPI00271AD1E1|nr:MULTISPECIES: hypothetical protein [unclassified Conexibacter]MDO8183985.1 hypothetical protein [Conexibacter sp. CPCC 205706]MDO8196977.1 hypothetical protein [Conexibacter sp. CPCC 205762]MDR9369053.1 hypothetical protein [Conexibacter sp. JD483]
MSRRTLYHVSASVNRDSILAHGLDPRLMGAARGIAGSERRELDGVFVCHDREDASWFVDMGRRSVGPVDLWAIDDSGSVLQTNSSGYDYLPVAVPPERVRLVESFGAPPPEQPTPAAEAFTAAIGDGASAQQLQELLNANGDGLFTYRFETVTDPAELVRPLGPRPGAPLPPDLAEDVTLVLHDVDRWGAITSGWSATVEGDLPQVDPERGWDDETDYGWLMLHDADGHWRGSLVVPLGPTAADRRAGLASAFQQQFVEVDEVDGTLHPMCVLDHPHAAVTEVRDGEAWWVCPADGRALAPVGSYAP